jgi:hypothetical protein
LPTPQRSESLAAGKVPPAQSLYALHFPPGGESGKTGHFSHTLQILNATRRF